MAEDWIVSIPAAPLPYYLESGVTVYRPGEQHPNRKGLGMYDWIVVESGVLYIGEEDRRWEIGPGQALLLHPDRYHYSVRPCEEETRFYWVHFQTGDLEAPVARSYSLRLQQVSNLPSPEHTFRQLERLLQLKTERRSSAFWQEQSIFLELLQLLDESGTEQEGSRSLAVAEQVEAYIRRHYREPLTNTKLSEALHFHYNYLTRCMKEIYGISPMEFLQATRLEQAKLLLIRTDWSIARVAEYVGFEYTPYFSRCFSERNGISPLQFRKQYSK